VVLELDVMATLKLFFSTDIHGSEKTFVKFLNSAKFYGVNTLIMGGDITGKMVVPLVSQIDGSYKTTFLGSDITAKTSDDLINLEKQIRFNGFYPYRTDPKELEELKSDSGKVDQLFSRLMAESIQRWIGVAEDRLQKLGVRCFITPGNDDRFQVDEALGKSNYVVNPEGKVIDLEGYEMISTGYSNKTPFNAPREEDEDSLGQRIARMIEHTKNLKSCIFNFHCPPYDSGIDLAPQLDKDMRPILSPSGGFEMVPAGSTAVRKMIEEHQPLLGLHGHIHESSGIKRIGRTLCVNPGSQYADGVLRGALVTIKDGKVENYLLTRG